MVDIFNRFKDKHNTLHTRFLLRVLAPPFLALLVVSTLGFWMLNNAVRANAIDGLKRAAATTAAKVEREFGLRQTVLESTGAELFTTKKEYAAQRIQLEQDHVACKDHVRKSSNFLAAPNNVCKPFLPQIAEMSVTRVSLTQAVENGYVEQATQLNEEEASAIKESLDAYVKFFPETTTLIVIDTSGKIVSQASSGKDESTKTTDKLIALAKKSLKQPVVGELVSAGSRSPVFAYQIPQGAVLATYNLDHASFLENTWVSAPIDNTKAYAVITTKNANLSYPFLEDSGIYQSAATSSAGSTNFKSKNVSYVAVNEKVGQTDWRVVVGSPAAIVLTPVRQAQLWGVLVIGTLLVSFLWLGAIFVHRTIRSIIVLAAGAIIFSSNKLDYRIKLQDQGDKEFDQLADTLNHMATRIQEAEQLVDQRNKEFINIATHELKAPMTAIIGNLSMVLEDGVGSVDETARKLANEAYGGTIRLRNLVTEMLDIARLESGRAQFNIVPLDLNKETTEIIAMQKVPAEQKGVTVNFTPSQLPPVMADQTKLQIILTNFISNAIKYNRSQGSVTISHVPSEAGVNISIQDTGLGIPKDQQKKMFQKFFRVEGEDRKNIPGTGLGMYITKQFIENMGGKLWFESEAGQGTTFYFSLPIATDASTASNEQVIAPQAEPGSSQSR